MVSLTMISNTTIAQFSDDVANELEGILAAGLINNPANQTLVKGVLQGKMRVYEDTTDESIDKITVSYNAAMNAMDIGVFYTPYMPLMSVSMTVGTAPEREPIEDLSTSDDFIFCLRTDDTTTALFEKAKEALEWASTNTNPKMRKISMELRPEEKYKTRYGLAGVGLVGVQDVHVRFLRKEDAAKFKLMFM